MSKVIEFQKLLFSLFTDLEIMQLVQDYSLRDIEIIGEGIYF